MELCSLICLLKASFEFNELPQSKLEEGIVYAICQEHSEGTHETENIKEWPDNAASWWTCQLSVKLVAQNGWQILGMNKFPSNASFHDIKYLKETFLDYFIP